jgi:hypothetical protein
MGLSIGCPKEIIYIIYRKKHTGMLSRKIALGMLRRVVSYKLIDVSEECAVT